MKRLLFFIVLLLSLESSAQSFSVNYVDTVEYGMLGDYITVFGTITNNNLTDTLTLVMEVTNIEMPSDWTLQFCDPSGCQPPGVTIDTFYMLPGASSGIYVEFLTSITDSVGTCLATITEVGNPTETASFNLYGITNAFVSICECYSEFGIQQNYPNPGFGSTTIKYNIKESAVLLIVDAVGNEIRTYELNEGDGYLNVVDLPAGHYFYGLTTSAQSSFKRMIIIK